MMKSFSTIYLGYLPETAFGSFRIAASDLGLLAVEWVESQPEQDAYLGRFRIPIEEDQKKIRPYAAQLGEYLLGKRRAFDFNIQWDSLRPFQRNALQSVYRVPYGQTRTYAEIAVEIGHPHAYRAVGRANATNPMPLVIPCHRLIGTDGKLHGYGGKGGLKTKERLLKMECGYFSSSA